MDIDNKHESLTKHITTRLGEGADQAAIFKELKEAGWPENEAREAIFKHNAVNHSNEAVGEHAEKVVAPPIKEPVFNEDNHDDLHGHIEKKQAEGVDSAAIFKELKEAGWPENEARSAIFKNNATSVVAKSPSIAADNVYAPVQTSTAAKIIFFFQIFLSALSVYALQSTVSGLGSIYGSFGSSLGLGWGDVEFKILAAFLVPIIISSGISIYVSKNMISLKAWAFYLQTALVAQGLVPILIIGSYLELTKFLFSSGVFGELFSKGETFAIYIILASQLIIMPALLAFAWYEAWNKGLDKG